MPVDGLNSFNKWNYKRKPIFCYTSLNDHKHLVWGNAERKLQFRKDSFSNELGRSGSLVPSFEQIFGQVFLITWLYF